MSEQNAGIEVRRITFDVGGDEVVGLFHVPAGEGPFPALLFEGPLTSVKEQVTGNYARALAAQGFAGLSIDHRYFGESGGKPRQFEHPGHKVEDQRAALDWLAAQPEVDAKRIGAIGVCAGAGYLSPLIASEDRIRAWCTVAGFFHDAGMQRQWMGDDGYDAAVAKAIEARKHYEETGEATTIPAVGEEGEVAMPLKEAFEYYGTPRGAVPNYTNAFARMSREHTLPWDAQAVAAKIQTPTLMVHSEKALAPSLARKFFDALAGPKQDQWLTSKGQIDFYDEADKIDETTTHLVAHFQQHMPA